MYSAILAMDQNQLIGNTKISGNLPWSFATDMKQFREHTYGHSILMGANTFASLGYRKLGGRRNIVLSTHLMQNYYPDVEIYTSIDDILAQDISDMRVIGGANIYSQFIKLGLIDRILVTYINGCFEGDIYLDSGLFDNFDGKLLQSTSDTNKLDQKIYKLDFWEYQLI